MQVIKFRNDDSLLSVIIIIQKGQFSAIFFKRVNKRKHTSHKSFFSHLERRHWQISIWPVIPLYFEPMKFCIHSHTQLFRLKEQKWVAVSVYTLLQYTEVSSATVQMYFCYIFLPERYLQDTHSYVWMRTLRFWELWTTDLHMHLHLNFLINYQTIRMILSLSDIWHDICCLFNNFYMKHYFYIN